MKALILLGQKRAKDGSVVVVNLYTGQNGVELEDAAKKAAESGEGFTIIGKIINPLTVNMPVDPTATTRSTPTFIKRELPKQKTKKLPPGGVGNPEPKAKPSSEGLRSDGPTFDEFVVGGGKPEDYPPSGYVGKQSEGWDIYKRGVKARLSSKK